VCAPPVTIWPDVERRAQLPADVERMIDQVARAVSRPPFTY
jgi:hypothetical protein